MRAITPTSSVPATAPNTTPQVAFARDRRRVEVDRTPSADPGTRPFLVRGLPDATQPELLVDLRRHPFNDARAADPDWCDPGDALHAACRHGLQVGRKHRARRQLWLAVA